MKRAIIDLGTNTFNLLVAEISSHGLNVIHHDKEAVLIGMGGINNGIITDDAMERALSTIERFAQQSRAFGVDKVLGFGTSMLRSASNAAVLIEQAKIRANVDVKVISGKYEARMIHDGVAWSHQFEGDALIMDIGGGSTELILGDDHGIKELVSLDIGVSRIYQMLENPIEYSQEHYRKIDKVLDGHTGFFTASEVSTLIGASGGFETLYEMINKKRFTGSSRTMELKLDSVLNELEWIQNASFEERVSHPWIVRFRVEMLPITARKIAWILEKFKIEKMYVSPYSLKEGLLLNAMK